jgi:hypothetical protein
MWTSGAGHNGGSTCAAGGCACGNGDPKNYQSGNGPDYLLAGFKVVAVLVIAAAIFAVVRVIMGG